MRINSINNIQYKTYIKKTENNSNPVFNHSKPTNPNSFYFPFISFKGGKNEISLIKQIAESLQDNTTPQINQTESHLPQKIVVNDIDSPIYNEVLKNKKQELTKSFIDNTKAIYEDPNAGNEEKLKAVQTAYAFIQDKETKYKEPSSLGDYLNSLSLSVETNHTVFAGKSLDNLFKNSQQYWETEYLPKLLDKEKNKLQYLEKFFEKRPDFEESKTFNDLSYDDQYFIAKYLEINNFKVYKDDPIVGILKNTAIKDKKDVLNEIRKKIVLDTEIFNDALANVPELLKDNNGIKFLSEYIITGKNEDDKTSLLKSLLVKLNNEKLLNSTKEEQVEYFESLKPNDINEAIEKVRKEWFLKYVPLKTEKEVAYQSHKNNIHVQNHEQLVSINEQLEKINIKLDKISLSLTEFISNFDRAYAKFPNPVEDSIAIQKNTGLQIEAMYSATKNLNSEEEQRLMNAFKTEGIKYLDILLDNTKDDAVKTMIQNLKKVITEEKKPNAILSKLESYGTMAIMSGLLHGGATSAAASHTVNSLVNTDIASGTGLTSVSTGGGISALLNPQALAIVAIAAGLHAITNANKVHKQFSDMYFGGQV